MTESLDRSRGGRRTVRRVASMALAASMLAIVPGAAAQASAAQPGETVGQAGAAALSGWLGTCYAQFPNSWTAGGWCDGNGPDWTYRGVVHCSNGGSYFGVMRWAGDRRKSFGLCQNSTGVWGGLYYFYRGTYSGSVIRAM
jgi:hypothetical protein